MFVAKSLTHFFCVPFTGLGVYSGFRGNKWLKDRIKIFKNFTLASLLNQNEKRFVLWLCFRPEEKNNPQIIELRKTLEGLRGLSFVMTFSGICLYDDKYPDAVAKTRLLNALRGSLPELKEYVGNSDFCAVTCQPSDDCFAWNGAEQIRAIEPRERLACGYTEGYIMSTSSMEIAEYNPETCPPFSTIFYPKDIFFSPEKHLEYLKGYKSHEDVPEVFNFIKLFGKGFCVLVHGQNTSSSWSIPYKGREILGEERENVLLRFGLWFSDPVIIHRGARLWGRILYNKLPRPLASAVRKWYHKLRWKYVNYF